jgi:hypothetical protein
VGALAEELRARRDRPFTLQEFAKHEAREKYCSMWTLALIMSLTKRDR